MGLPVLAAIAAGLKIAGKVREGVAAHQAGVLNDRIAKFEASGIRRDTAAQEDRIRDEVRRQIGTQLVAQGESGFEMGTGSALDALMASQVEGMLDQLTVRRRGTAAADARSFQGTVARRQGNEQARAAYFGAAEALASTAANYANYGSGRG